MTKVKEIEVTQGIQTLHRNKNIIPVKLLVGKKTLVRVYIGRVDGYTPLQGHVIDGVLKISMKGKSDVHLWSSNQVQRGGDSPRRTDHQRADLDSTLNFEFEATDLFGGDLAASKTSFKIRFEIETLEVNGKPVKKPVGKCAIDCEFHGIRQFKLHLLGLRYKDLGGLLYFPDKGHFENIKNSIENLYPINHCRASHIVIDADASFTLPFSNSDETEPDWEWFHKVSLAHAQALAFRTLDMDANLEFAPESNGSGAKTEPFTKLSETWYYSVVDYPDDDFFRGAASGVQNTRWITGCREERKSVEANFDFVACGPVEGAGGLYAAHEVAHCLDLHHPGIGDQPGVETEYPFQDGFISVNSFPSMKPFGNSRKYTRSEIKNIVQASFTDEALINNKTLQLIVDKHNKVKYQGSGSDEGDRVFNDEMQDWSNAVSNYGAEHQGLRWDNWESGKKLLSHVSHYDFMGYLDPKWISSFSYDKLYRNINEYREIRTVEGEPDQPPNLCIIGIYNEFLGTASIRYVFRTHEKPKENEDESGRSVQIQIDGNPVNGLFVHHKNRNDNKLGDRVFLRAGIFKCVISESSCLESTGAEVSFAYSHEIAVYIAESVTGIDRNCGHAPADSYGDAGGKSKAGAKPVSEPIYKKVDRILLKNGTESHCKCEQQPFRIIRSSPESEQAEFYIKLTGQMASDCTYIARARFLDRDLFEKKQKVGLTNWMTIGINFRSTQYLYVDKYHCLLPGRSIRKVFGFLFGNGKIALEEPFLKIDQVYREANNREKSAMDLFAFAVEIICLSGLNNTRVFKGLVIEKPHKPGKFYFINSDDPKYLAIKKVFEDLS